MEFNYQAFKLTKNVEFQFIRIIDGCVDLENMELTENDQETPVKVRRTPNNERNRPNARQRHDPVDDDLVRLSDVHFLNNETDLEWLSLNYRKNRAAKITKSRRRMILIMFTRDISYFPSMKEIRDELI